MKGGRLLLVELVYADAFENLRAELFPLYAAAAERAGIPCLWLRVPLSEADRSPRNRYLAALGADKRRELAARAAAFGPTRALSNEKLSAETAAALRRELPGCRWSSAADGEAADLSRLLAAAGGSAAGTPAALFEVLEPRYEPEWLGEPPKGRPRLLKVLCGDECLYRRPLAGNPFFEGLDLSAARSRSGCSFCGSPAHPLASFSTPAVELAMRQIDAAMASRSLARERKSFMICGIQLFHALEVFFETLRARGHPGADFYFSCRVDEFLAKADAIERELPAWRERGHALHLWNMGAENLSPAENQRLNKGVSIEQIERALGRLSALESSFPDAFFFRKHGGLGLIVFTPWTTLEDLRLNVRAARRLGLGGSLFFNSRLQLMPGLPITLLARKDGLLAERFGDRPYDSGCISDWNASEVPWRFRDPAVALAYRISMRLEPMEDMPKEDPVRRLLELAARRRDTLDLLERVIDELERRPAQRSVPAILRAVLSEAR